MHVKDVLDLDGLSGDSGKVKAPPRVLVLRTATRVDGDGLTGPDYGRDWFGLFHEKETTWDRLSAPLRECSTVGG